MATLLTKPSDLTASNYKKARILAFNEHVEEDVTLLVDGTVVNCFISYCPYEIEVGKFYDVELTMNLADDYELDPVEPSGLSAVKIDPGFTYLLYGELYDDKFLTFTSLNDEGIHYDHPDCNEHFVRLKVERIDASFR
ncbi:hypothetical protein DYL61_17515 [Pseudomonas nabeulensis]|uniref:Uncharacterized protein n=1 Tax=Pseudomonas nabeulensis TaxID=2293833 RepID=A0A4Z0B0Q1_9PSED|nr:hypothetical protein [Pseudomonas nabeulensis]TFY92271.1 hypothetical protein DYL61_17515 [Pseudomonas nabeulensis]